MRQCSVNVVYGVGVGVSLGVGFVCVATIGGASF